MAEMTTQNVAEQVSKTLAKVFSAVAAVREAKAKIGKAITCTEFDLAKGILRWDPVAALESVHEVGQKGLQGISISIPRRDDSGVYVQGTLNLLLR